MFEAKVYNDVRKTIGLANCAYAVAVILAIYFLVLSSDERKLLPTTADQVGLPPWIAGTLSVAFVAGLWAYVSTALLRLHDRVFEPWLIEWRRYYETDFILRGLCFDFSDIIAGRAFEEAFESPRKRGKLMQKLFYAFVGDHVDQHAALRDRFYSHIRNYWIIGLGEVYSLSTALIAVAIGWLSEPASRKIILFVGACMVISLALRVAGWRYLHGVRGITDEQISVVLHEHKEEFSKALNEIVDEMGLRR